MDGKKKKILSMGDFPNFWKDYASQNIAVFLLAVLGCLVTVEAFFPGGVSHDTLQQYAQALTGDYSDWHPPVMAALWRWLMLLWPNPGVLLVFHNLCYWGFWYFLASSFFKDRGEKLAAFSLAFLPPLWSQAHVLWKDSEFSFCLFGCFFFVTRAKEEMHKGTDSKPAKAGWLWGAALLLFVYAAWVRSNSLPALLPLAYFSFFRRTKGGGAFPAVLAACALTALTLVAGTVFDYGLLKAKRQHLSQMVQIHDIAGVFAETGRADFLPAYWQRLNPQATPLAVLRHFSPSDIDPLVWNGPVRMTTDPDDLKELQAQWLRALREEPGPYLRYRWENFKSLLGVGLEYPANPFHFQVDPNPLGLKEQADPQLKGLLTGWFSALLGSLMFKGWFYTLAALGLVGWGLLQSGAGKGNLYGEASLFSALSALGYEAGYFFYAIGCDFRYLYATVLLVFFSALMAFLAFRQAPVGMKIKGPKASHPL